MVSKSRFLLMLVVAFCGTLLVGYTLFDGVNVEVVEGFKTMYPVDGNAGSINSISELRNVDIVRTGERMRLRTRDGFSKMGTWLTGGRQVNGLFTHKPAEGTMEVIAVSGDSIFIYREELGDFVELGFDPRVGEATVETGDDTVRGQGTLWWEMSDHDWDSINVEGELGEIKEILSDTILTLTSSWAGANYTVASACTLRPGSFSTGSKLAFNSQQTTKYGLTFLDTLVMIDGETRAKFHLGASGSWQSISTPRLTDCHSGGCAVEVMISGGIPTDFVATLEKGDWIHIRANNPDGNNVAKNFYVQVFSAAADDINLRVNEDWWDWFLLGDTDSSYTMSAQLKEDVSFDTVFDGTITRVEDSTITTAGCGDIIRAIVKGTNDGAFPRDLPTDSFPMGLFAVEPFANAFYPVELITGLDDSTYLKIYDRWGHFDIDSTIVLFTITQKSNDIVADTLAHEPWDHEGQVILNNRLYQWGVEPTLLEWFEEFHLDSTSGAGFVYIDRDGGDKLTVFVPLGRNGVAFMRNRAFDVSISPYDNAPEDIRLADIPTGAPSQFAVDVYGNKIYFCSPSHGVFSYDGNSSKLLSGPISSYFPDSLRAGWSSYISVKVFRDPNMGTAGLYISYPSEGGFRRNDRILRYDLETGAWTKYVGFGFREVVVMTSADGYGDTLAFGTQGAPAFVFQYPSGQYDTGTTVIPIHISTGYSSMGSARYMKTANHILPYVKADSTPVITYRLIFEGETTSVTHAMVGSGAWEYPLLGVNGGGKLVKFQVDADSAQGYELDRVEIFTQPGGTIGDE